MNVVRKSSLLLTNVRKHSIACGIRRLVLVNTGKLVSGLTTMVLSDKNCKAALILKNNNPPT